MNIRPVLACLGVLLLAAASCGGGDASPTPTEGSPSTSADASPPTIRLTYDGERCSSSGPTELALSEPVTVEMQNDADHAVFGQILWFTDAEAAAAAETIGTDFAWEAGAPLPLFYVEVSAGAFGTTTSRLVAPGFYVVECVNRIGATAEHVWRPAAFRAIR